jgi:hypothetical protein
MRNILVKTIYIGVLYALLSVTSLAQAAPTDVTTPWHNSKLHVDVAGVIGRSAIVLGQPNVAAAQAMPLGNGQFGVAVRSANGLTAQLNR